MEQKYKGIFNCYFSWNYYISLPLQKYCHSFRWKYVST